jgi:YD repeat-containing protein
MRIKILSIIGLFSLIGFSQVGDPLTLPNYTPPSPDAFAMTKYGDVPINEFTGMVSQTIPLYTYKAGQLELPISINYTGAGVKVDDLPTWVGINWTLNAGGVITRNVNDIADENSTTRLIVSDILLDDYSLYTEDGTQQAIDMRDFIENGQVDSEVDIFQFSFPGGSGSFYFDENFEPRQVKYDKEIKIELTGNIGQNNKTRLLLNKEFAITTTDGIKYYFGGTETEETTRLYTTNAVMDSPTNTGVTAFYLTKIEHPINGVILFEYTNGLPQKTVPMQQIQKIEKLIFISNLSVGCNSADVNSTTIQNTSISIKIVDPKYLVKISSVNNSETVNFYSINIDNLNFKRVLNKIEIKKIADTIFKTIDFEFTPFTTTSYPQGNTDNTKRFFLEKIIFDKDISPNTLYGRRNEVYSFEYNNYGQLPKRFSFSQDYLGFFNGKPNTSSIPDDNFSNPNNQPNFADRNPVFGYASIGTLNKITYPTGGYTKFEYEGTKAKIKNYKNINLWAYRNHQEFVNPNLLISGIPEITTEGTIYGLNNIYETQSIDIKVTLVAGPASETSIIPQNEFATLTIKDLTINSPMESFLIAMPSPTANINFSGTKQKTVSIPRSILQGHNYEIKIIINPIDPSINPNPTPMEAFVNIEYFDGYTIVNNLGVRLKKQTNFTSENYPENIKRYYYSEIDKLYPSLDELPLYSSGNYRKYEYRLNNYVCQNLDSTTGAVDINVQKYLSLMSDKIDISNKLNYGNYEHVTISFGGDNFENGGIEKTFQTSNNIGAMQIDTKLSPSPSLLVSENKSLVEPAYFLNSIDIPFPNNGNLKNEKYYNNTLKKVSEKIYEYDSDQVHRLNNIIGKKEYDILLYATNATTSNIVSNYTIGTYIRASSKNEIKKEITIQYIDPVPLGVTDESIYDKIATTQDYYYGTLRGLPTKVVANSNDNAMETRYIYPNQVSQLTGLTPSHIDAVNELTNQFKIATPIQVEKYLNGNKQETIRTLYKEFYEEPKYALPEIIQSSKDNQPFEDRVLIKKYDPSGNPTEVKLADGSITKYYYNNKNQVMGKIENYQISPTLPVGTEFVEIQEGATQSQSCANNLAYPNSIVTTYVYKSSTDLLIQITDTNCKTTYYEYDLLHRLKYIKDHESNILQEFETNYKRY